MNRVTVKIANQEYTITGEHKREYILQVAAHVDEKYEELRSMNPRLSPGTIAILTAVNIAEEYYAEVQKNGEMDRNMKLPIKELEGMKSRVAELEKNLILKEQEIRDFDKKRAEFDEKIKAKEKEAEEMLKRLDEKEKSVKEAEELVNDAQNRLYELQLKVIELEEKSGDKR
ncbi:MAG: cell division protein ZapA [Peptostreptococcaceae bacterium]|nr:cell division protein ZapA [Peptostreptococcaceae bacterium]